LVAVTAPLDGLIVAFQALVTVCPEGRVKPSFQPSTAVEPVLVTVMFSVSPVFQALTVSETLHVPPPLPVLDADGEAEGLVDGEEEADGDADALAEGLPPLPAWMT
jgi:hypothetical protein